MPATVVVTRAAHQSDELTDLLLQGGLKVIDFPTIRIDYLPTQIDWTGIDWIVFASANAARSVLSHDAALPLRTQFAAIGSATAEAIETSGYKVHWVSPVANASGLVDALLPLVRGRSVFIPMSDRSDPAPWERLRAQGTRVISTVTYVTRCETGHSSEQIALLAAADMVLFASPSAFECFCQAVSSEMLSRLQIAVIGPTTRHAVERGGFVVALESPTPRMAAFAQAVIECVEVSE